MFSPQKLGFLPKYVKYTFKLTIKLCLLCFLSICKNRCLMSSVHIALHQSNSWIWCIRKNKQNWDRRWYILDITQIVDELNSNTWGHHDLKDKPGKCMKLRWPRQKHVSSLTVNRQINEHLHGYFSYNIDQGQSFPGFHIRNSYI